MTRHRVLRSYAGPLATLWILGTGAVIAPLRSTAAQTTETRAAESRAAESRAPEARTTAARPVSASEQGKLYDDLARDAGEMQRFAGVLKKIARLVKPAVVHIEADKDTSGEFGRRHVEEAGSGVIVEQGGKFYVVTNRHVIKDAEIGRIKVRLSDGREVGPQKTWADAETDVAVMSLSGTDYSAARLGDSDRLEIGDFVLAIGSPFGLSHSMTLGIVSAKDRRNLALGDERLKYQDFIQTDAAINPGNSGGPLLNLRGEVIGINTAIATNSGKNEGIGFAIPTSMVDVVVKQLVENGTVQRAHLGVSLDDKFGPAQAARIGLLRPEGARITAVEPKSPAEVAAIQVGDVILSYNGKHVDDESHLMNLVSLTPIGADVAVVVYRGKQEIAIRVKVGDKANSLWSQKRNNGRP